MSWISLHNHSQFSILDSTASLKALTQRAATYEMPSLALTDYCNMYGAVEFYKACKGVGIKPIIGCEVMVAPFSRHDKKKIVGVPNATPLVLLATNQQGYKNLCKIVSIGFLEGFYYTPRIDKEILEAHSEGLICLSGPLHGMIGRCIIQEKEEELSQEIDWLLNTFTEGVYFELQRHGMSDQLIQSDGLEREVWVYQRHQEYVANQEKLIERLKVLSKEKGIPLVATNGVHYIERDDWQAHEILMNVQSGEPCEIWERDSFGNPRARIPNPKRKILPSHEFYFKSPEEMEALFADIPEAIKNTHEIADKCHLEIDLKAKFYPVFVPPSLEGKEYTSEVRIKETEQHLRTLCNEGISKRYTEARLKKVQEKYPDKDPLEIIKERLNQELEIITSKGMCDYLLIVYDFIAWAKGKDIPVGPGRGSGAGSIILYLIGITDIEPLRFNLFFERFINPERISYPDIDVDICMERREEVIEYTLNKYGRDKVAQIITFGRMKAKMAIKDVGRVLSVPLAKVNEIAKLVPDDLNMTLDKALEIDPELQAFYERDEDAKRVLDLGRKVEGSIRNTGIHAAGLIICGDPLTDHIPVCSAKDSEIMATQYSMKPVEAVGMLKIDFLGLKTLTSIQKAANAVAQHRGVEIDWIDLPFDDAPTFELLNQGKTLGIFQLESTGMQELAKQLHIDKFEEIVAVGALYRPGPMEMIPSFINRKHGREKIEYDHPLIKDILDETYGIMVYQEQVMQISQRLAKYSLGEGDVLRRAMGKKDREEMSRQREKFEKGAVANGIDASVAMKIFDKIEKFASYGFNKSHAAAYGYLSYVTAYFKANYPKEWMAALMTCDMADLSKVAKFIRECQAMEIKILSPDINESSTQFVATTDGIRFAMAGIKGVGRGVVEAIIHERETDGKYKSLSDFLERIDTKKVGKKAIETLIDSGCLDFTNWSRPALRIALDLQFDAAVRRQKEKAQGVQDLFANFEEEEAEDLPPDVEHPPSKQEVLQREKELLGFYLTGHPMDDYQALVQKLSIVPLHDIEKLADNTPFRTAAIIETVKVRISAKNQRKFAILTLSDGMDRYELPIWSNVYEEKSHLFVENQLIYGVVQIDKSGEFIRLRCRWIDDLTAADEEMIRKCDEAYESAKHEKKRPRKMEKPKIEKPKEKLTLIVNADLIRLSHILKLKELFYQFSGDVAVDIRFANDEKKGLGMLQIDPEWGIRFDKELEARLKEYPFINSIELQTGVV